MPVINSRHSRRSAYPKRARHLKGFLTQIATKLAATPTGITFTADGTTANLTAAAHGISNGDGPFLVSNAGGALPGGLAASTEYWATGVTTNTFQLSKTRKNPVPIVTTSAGTGTQTVARDASSKGIFGFLRKYKANTVLAAADIDNLK